jgi:hypothetical protein
MCDYPRHSNLTIPKTILLIDYTYQQIIVMVFLNVQCLGQFRRLRVSRTEDQ